MTTAHAESIATRIKNAHADFDAVIVEIAGCTADEAKRVTAHYLKIKAAKLDLRIGRIQVTHGMYLDADVVKRAVEATR